MVCHKDLANLPRISGIPPKAAIYNDGAKAVLDVNIPVIKGL